MSQQLDRGITSVFNPIYSSLRDSADTSAVVGSDITVAQVLAIWQDVFERDAIDLDDDFFVLGGYSLLVVDMIARIKQEFALEMPLHQIFETPTPRQMAKYITLSLAAPHDQSSSRISSGLVTLQRGGDLPPLFCTPVPDGIVYAYQPLTYYLAPDQPVYGIEPQGLSNGAEALTDITDIAAYSIAQMKTAQPTGPYYLLGYSYGGMIALEIAQQLQAAGEKVALLGLIDSWLVTHPAMPRQSLGLWWLLIENLRRITRHVAHFKALSLRQKLSYFPRVGSAFLKRRSRRQTNAIDVYDEFMGRTTKQLPQQIVVQSEASKQAYRSYLPQRYAGPIVYFRALQQTQSSYGFDQTRAWSWLARGGMTVYDIPGDHTTMLKQPNVRILGKLLRLYMAEGTGSQGRRR